MDNGADSLINFKKQRSLTSNTPFRVSGLLLQTPIECERLNEQPSSSEYLFGGFQIHPQAKCNSIYKIHVSAHQINLKDCGIGEAVIL